MTIPDSMAAVAMQGHGGPEVLVAGMRPVPRPSATQVLIQVAGAGVNGPDIMQRKGLYPAPPGASDLLGLEVAGTVVARGDGVTAWAVGDQVAALTDGGGYAQYCVADARHCLPIPAGVSVRDAAGLPESFITVWSNLFLEGGLKARPCSSTGGPAASAQWPYSLRKRLASASSRQTARRGDARSAPSWARTVSSTMRRRTSCPWCARKAGRT